MKLEDFNRRDVYYVKNGTNHFQFLVLGRTANTLCIADVRKRNKEIWDKLTDCKVENVGAVCIDSIRSKDESWIEKFTFDKLTKLNKRQYASIIGYIRDFYLGDIVFDTNALCWCYEDELTEVENTEEEQNKEVESEADGESHIESVNEPVSEEKTKENDEVAVDNNEIVDLLHCDNLFDGLSLCTDEDDSELDDDDFIIEDREGISIDLSEEPIYDLMKTPDKVEDPSDVSSYHSPTYKDGGRRRNKYRLFRYSEMLWISKASIKSIRIKFNVNESTASRLRINARIILDGYSGMGRKIKHDFTRLFDENYTVEEIVDMFDDVETYVVESAYKNYLVSRSVPDNGNLDAMDKWENNIATMSYNELADAIDCTIVDFAARERCSSATARKIIYDIKQKVLYKDPFYLVFGIEACDDNFRKNMKSLVFSDKVSDISNYKLYELIHLMRNWYRKSYDDHVDIVNNSKEVPDYVPEEYKDRFIRLIAHRFLKLNQTFNEYKTKPRNQYSIAEVCLEFLIRYESAGGALSRSYKPITSNHNEKEDG